MRRLYDICEELRNFELEIDEDTGEVLNIDELDKLELEKEIKVENIGLIIKDYLAEYEALKQEKDKIAKRQAQAQKKAEKLKDYLLVMLEGETFKTPKIAISYRKSDSLEVLDMNKIPEEYLKYKEPEVNKMDLKKAIKAGLDCEGATIVTNVSMQIK